MEIHGVEIKCPDCNGDLVDVTNPNNSFDAVYCSTCNVTHETDEDYDKEGNFSFWFTGVSYEGDLPEQTLKYLIKTDIKDGFHKSTENIKYLQKGDELCFKGGRYNVEWKILDLDLNEFIIAVSFKR